MRLWHKDLIKVLPRQQLLGQWRECCLIAKEIKEKGTPNHLLVNKIMDYPIEDFYLYIDAVWIEMIARGYYADLFCICKYFPEFRNKTHIDCRRKDYFKDWHNDRYLKQCYYNLQEKYDCGGITKEEWILIETACGGIV